MGDEASSFIKSGTLEIGDEDSSFIKAGRYKYVIYLRSTSSSCKWIVPAIVTLLLLVEFLPYGALARLRHQEQQQPLQTNVSIAFIGNSFLYFNDFPRFLEQFTAQSPFRIQQNSCLHGGSTLPSILIKGNYMHPQFATHNAILTNGTELEQEHTIYDYGACTVTQLLSGNDSRLEKKSFCKNLRPSASGYMNPCCHDPIYNRYARDYFAGLQPKWDYVLIQDNSRNAAQFQPRMESLESLESYYVPWFQRNPGATPVFLWTHSYHVDRSEHEMQGLHNLPNFTSLTGSGYKVYGKRLEEKLPPSQKPRIAPVGLAFLLVYEDRPKMWEKLFHAKDHLHASPSGTFLQGCILYHTLFGELPPKEQVVRHQMASFWKTARMMQHARDRPNPMPTFEMADYLYDVAERVMVHGEVPKSFVNYQNGEAAYPVG